MTLGEDRVRAQFNPAKMTVVEQIKQQTARLIDLCNEQWMNQDGVRSEEARLWALAMTAYEEAAMWAVKAATIKA